MKPIDLHIDGMTCSACSSRIERVLSRIPGVSAEVSLLEHRARITGLSIDDAIAAVRRAGYDAQPLEPRQRASGHLASTTASAHPTGLLQRVDFRLWVSVVCLPIMLIEMVAMAVGAHGWIHPLLQFALATLMQTFVAWPFYKSALRAITSASPNMETLVSIGTLTAYIWSVFAILGVFSQAELHSGLYFETSVIVIAMVRIGQSLERHARGQALSAIAQLTQLDASPVEYLDENSGQWSERHPDQIAIGALIRINPNQAISLDAVITEGQTEVDESSMTGESMPAVRHVGDTIYAGCVNLSGIITAKVIAGFQQSRRAQIGEKMLSALSSRAPIGALADRVAAIFVPTVLLIAIVTAAVHLAIGNTTAQSISYAVAVLVVACPCALGLATPAAIAAGLARSAQLGWFFRSADALQRAAEIDHVVFDKTGTLTSGRPSLIAIADGDSPSDRASRRFQHYSLDLAAPASGPWPNWLAAACAAEQGIEHPLAGAMLSYAAGRFMPRCTAIRHQPGQGVMGEITQGPHQGKIIRIGKPQWLLPAQAPQDLEQLYADASAVDISIDDRWAGRVWVSDSLRTDATTAINRLHQLGLQATIISGDRTLAVKRVSDALGGVHFLAQQSPEDKARQCDQWQREGQHVAMVGDGINDASALAHAHLGVGMASGATLTVESADLTISAGSPILDTIYSLEIAKAVIRRVKENLAFAFIFNIAAIPLAASGLLAPAVAGGAMALSSVAVVSNAVRLLKWKKPSSIV